MSTRLLLTPHLLYIGRILEKPEVLIEMQELHLHTLHDIYPGMSTIITFLKKKYIILTIAIKQLIGAGINRHNITTMNRDSNTELLRLVLMFFITIHHFIVHGIGYVGMSHEEILNLDKTYLLINSFVIIAVDCFVLISGYYGIKCSVRGTVRLYLVCTFYNLCSHFIAVYMGSGGHNLFHCFLPFSHSNGLWFIPVYFYLYILSPILNDFLQNCKLSTKYILIILSVLVVYFGYFWDAPISPLGYDLLNFVFIYVIGRCLRSKDYKILKKTKYCFAGYLVCALLIWGLSFYQESPMSHIVYLSAFKYNNPLVIASAVFFFHVFNNLRFHSEAVNFISSSTLAIYLFSENFNYIKWSRNIFEQNHFTVVVLFHFVILAIIMMAICLSIDKLRLLLFGKIEKWIVKQAESIWATLIKRLSL